MGVIIVIGKAMKTYDIEEIERNLRVLDDTLGVIRGCL